MSRRRRGFSRKEAMTHGEVGDGLVGPSGLDGWTNEMHCKL
jgi:hypothetical protein